MGLKKALAYHIASISNRRESRARYGAAGNRRLPLDPHPSLAARTPADLAGDVAAALRQHSDGRR